MGDLLIGLVAIVGALIVGELLFRQFTGGGALFANFSAVFTGVLYVGLGIALALTGSIFLQVAGFLVIALYFYMARSNGRELKKKGYSPRKLLNG